MTIPEKIRILIVDDHMVVRKGLVLVLGQQPDMDVIGEAESGEEAIYLAKKVTPDIVLMDVKMDGMGGIETTRVIIRNHQTIRVIGLSTFANRDVVRAMISAGASGYLLKDISASDLTVAIRRVYHGEILLPEQLPSASNIEDAEANTPPSYDVDTSLGQQQRRVLALLTKGLTNPEIAQHMGTSVSTTRYHVSTILRKLDVSNRSEAVALAIRMDIVDPQDI